jgi:hypothetical protein
MLKHRGWLSVSTLLFASRRTAAFALVVVLAACLGFSQASATLSETIKDPSGAIVPGVVVTLTKDQTAMEKRLVADETGKYSFSEMAPGAYALAHPPVQSKAV